MPFRPAAALLLALSVLTIFPAMAAQEVGRAAFGGKLLLTGGVTQVEGAAGGGLTPWAFIGGYGTRGQIGGNAFFTRVQTGDYRLDSYGLLVGIHDRVELSLARQRFDTGKVGAALGLDRGFDFGQTIVGAKVRIAGDGVLDQDRWLPQIAAGVQYKDSDRNGVLRAIGARHDKGVDLYASATKLLLAHSLLLNGTVRLTRANQAGILGFGGRDDDYRPVLEGSAALLLSRQLAVGAEYRMKPDNLAIAAEDDWYDLFVAWAPTKNASLTLAYANLGSIVGQNGQRALYVSLQVGF